MPLRWVVEFATELGVSDDTLYRLLKAGKLGRYKNERDEGDRKTYVDEEQARQALALRLISGPEPKEPGRIRPLRVVAVEWGVYHSTIERMVSAGTVAKYVRAGDARTYVDEEQVRAARGYRRVSGPPPE